MLREHIIQGHFNTEYMLIEGNFKYCPLMSNFQATKA